jgi:hypothetical protein
MSDYSPPTAAENPPLQLPRSGWKSQLAYLRVLMQTKQKLDQEELSRKS